MEALKEYLAVADFIANLILVPGALWILKVEKKLTAITVMLDIERELLTSRRRITDFGEDRRD